MVANEKRFYKAKTNNFIIEIKKNAMNTQNVSVKL